MTQTTEVVESETDEPTAPAVKAMWVWAGIVAGIGVGTLAYLGWELSGALVAFGLAVSAWFFHYYHVGDHGVFIR